MATTWKIYFVLLPQNWKLRDQLTLNFVESIRVTCRSKVAKIIPIGSQDGSHGGHLENLFCTCCPGPKGQLIWNLIWSIGATCRSKIAKIILIRNPRWLPWLPSWRSIALLLLTRKASWLEMIGSIEATCWSKIATIMLIGNQDGCYGSHLENLFCTSSPKL